MMDFKGWSNAALDFYRELEINNHKSFWTAHKGVYESEVREPFEALSELVADEFGALKVARPYRDVRFSRDKAPYKTNGYAIGEGEAGVAYYVAISSWGLVAATGYWMMGIDQLVRFRQAVDDDRKGPALESILDRLRGQKLDIQGQALKTAPRGYPRDHPRVGLLRHKSLAAMRAFEPSAWLATPEAAARITEVWRVAAPMNAWLAEHVGRSTSGP